MDGNVSGSCPVEVFQNYLRAKICNSATDAFSVSTFYALGNAKLNYGEALKFLPSDKVLYIAIGS
jgi:hypothetical protein